MKKHQFYASHQSGYFFLTSFPTAETAVPIVLVTALTVSALSITALFSFKSSFVLSEFLQELPLRFQMPFTIEQPAPIEKFLNFFSNSIIASSFC